VVTKTQDTSATNKSTKKASSMAELLANSSNNSVVSLHKGQTIDGVVTKLTPSEILVDVNAKSHALVLERDKRLLRYLLSTLKLGDKVTVSVISAESEFGYPVVSLRRFLDNFMWKKLEELKSDKKTINSTITGKTSGGYLVTTSDGITGFLPNSQSTFSDSDHTNEKADLYVLELQRDTRKVIFSQKASLDKEEFEQAVKSLKSGSKIQAVVTGITSFGVFVTVTVDGKPLDGFIHSSELSWSRDENPNLAAGDSVEAQVIGFDKDSKRINLSLKRLTTDPFEEKLKQYVVDQKTEGTVAKILSNGVIVDLEEGIEGFIRKEKIPVGTTYKEGESITATVSEVDKARHRVILIPVTLRKTIGYR